MTDIEVLKQASITMLTNMTQYVNDAIDEAHVAMESNISESEDSAYAVRMYAATMRDLAETMCLLCDYPYKIKAMVDELAKEE